MSRGVWRYAALEQNTEKIMRFCTQYRFEVKRLNNGYQLRIEDVLDVYPVRQRWHYLPTGERGDWDHVNDLKRVLLDRLPYVTEANVTIQKREGFKTIGQQPQGMNVLSVPAPKRLWPRLIWAKIWRRK